MVETWKDCQLEVAPLFFGRVFTVPDRTIHICVSISSDYFLDANYEIDDLGYYSVTDASRPLLITQRHGPIHYLKVVNPPEDTAYWDLEPEPVAAFRRDSCLDSMQYCEVAAALPLPEGFYVLDKHRLMEFGYNWNPDLSIDPTSLLDTRIAVTGVFNMEASGDEEMSVPRAMVRYGPFNSTERDEMFPLTPLFSHAEDSILFVSDTGRHRVIMFNISAVGQLERIGQFGETGVARNDAMGLNWPHGLALYAPSLESCCGGTLADVFVADRRNNRIVILSYGHPKGGPLDQIGLRYRGEYGGMSAWVNGTNYGVTDPVGIAIYRHYIFVAETFGNAITVLTLDYRQPDRLTYVMRLKAVDTDQITGHLITIPEGYIWYTYRRLPSEYRVASLLLPAELRYADEPSWLEDFLAVCVNRTFYDELLNNDTSYIEHMSKVLNMSGINWVFPDFDNYLDIYAFNATVYFSEDLTAAGIFGREFDFDLFNYTVYQGSMVYCTPPPTSTAPPMYSGNSDGWVAGGIPGSVSAAGQKQSPSVIWLWPWFSFVAAYLRLALAADL